MLPKDMPNMDEDGYYPADFEGDATLSQSLRAAPPRPVGNHAQHEKKKKAAKHHGEEDDEHDGSPRRGSRSKTSPLQSARSGPSPRAKDIDELDSGRYTVDEPDEEAHTQRSAGGAQKKGK